MNDDTPALLAGTACTLTVGGVRVEGVHLVAGELVVLSWKPIPTSHTLNIEFVTIPDPTADLSPADRKRLQEEGALPPS